MNIALVGYGKMGKEIEAAALDRGHTIGLVIDVNNQSDLTPGNLKGIDAAIEFSTPSTAYENILRCFNGDVPVVSGTTGWLDKFDEVKQLCLTNEQTFFYASNYSLGVNLFFKLNIFLAKIMNNYPDFEVQLTETHHTQKLDAPSGTAVTLASDLLKCIDRKKSFKLDQLDNPDVIGITAIRESDVPGIHTIKYESAVDSIEITHSAKNRKGFALGAVIAAEYIHDKKGFYTMDDLLQF
jgi:4-hydroxy-tetrahydrodipicolinate reductase